MFCPSCGANNSTVQKFCRSCGLNLEKAAEAIIEQLPNAHSASLLKREKRLDKFGDFAWNTFALVVIISIGWLIYHIATGTPIWYEGLIVAFIIYGVMAVTHMSLKKTHERRKDSNKENLLREAASDRVTAELNEPLAFDARNNLRPAILSEQKTRRLE